MEIYKATAITKPKGCYLIYGVPGMGKTSTAKYLPGKTLVLDIDRTSNVLQGCTNIDIVAVDNMGTYEFWKQLMVDLVKNYQGVYDNIFVDNLSELERCVLADFGRQGNNMGIPAQKDYQVMQFLLVNTLRHLKQMDCNIILTAWETTELYTESTGQQYNRSYPQINKKVVDNICGLCNVVGRMTVNKEGNRGFILSATNSTYAKNQLDDRKGCLQSELIPKPNESEALQNKPTAEQIVLEASRSAMAAQSGLTNDAITIVSE